MKHTSVRIDDKTYAWIVKYAKEEERSVNKMINLLLKQELRERGLLIEDK